MKRIGRITLSVGALLAAGAYSPAAFAFGGHGGFGGGHFGGGHFGGFGHGFGGGHFGGFGGHRFVGRGFGYGLYDGGWDYPDYAFDYGYGYPYGYPFGPYGYPYGQGVYYSQDYAPPVIVRTGRLDRHHHHYYHHRKTHKASKK